MNSTRRSYTSPIRILPAAALLAALFIPLVAASADDGCPPNGCPLNPPQSREINPSPARADGSAVEVPEDGTLPPVEITVHVLAPAFVEPAPVGASFETISVPVRYQDPGDVSCGVQALGMAMDALPGAAPTSASMMGLLQDNGMMYDFGTGVEELAYAAQSFGYTGSFAFHGATIEQLEAELASGHPVVVDLGANGVGEPGHFVTLTGVSGDGQFVAYNDPTLGEQVISVSEFERLWGLQGNSGVVVAAEPPPASGVDPGVLSLWVAFAAGLMALVSTTPLARLRQGIGGMLDANGGRGVSYAPARSAPKASPPAKEKEKEKEKKSKPKKTVSSVGATPSELKASQPASASKVMATPSEQKVTASPKATTARFDDELVLPTVPVSKVIVTPTELKVAQAASAAQVYPTPRFDDERSATKPSSGVISTPAEWKGAQAPLATAKSSSTTRFDDDVAVEKRAGDQEAGTPPLEKRAATAILVAPVLVIADITLALLTATVSTALAADPEPLTKLALATVDTVLAAADLYLAYQHVNYAHWIVTGNTIESLDDLQDWAWRP